MNLNFVKEMKKLLVIMLLCVYGFSATGATLHFHFCCGKLDDISLVPAGEAACKMKEAEPQKAHCAKMAKPAEKKNCCDEKQVSFKVKDVHAHSQAQAVKMLAAAYTVPKPQAGFDAVTEPLASSYIEPTIFAPPPLLRPLRQLYCTYLI